MIHYHGSPITPATAAHKAYDAGHAFVSIRSPTQMGLVLEVCQSFAVDNGAFSAWKSGSPVTDWNFYYDWVAELWRYPSFDFAVIPDVIDGTEEDNDELVNEWPWKDAKSKWVGAPVWHMHESIERLQRLAREFPRVCIGSSGQYATVGNKDWWVRMTVAMDAITDKHNRPICKLHGLRMLNPRVFTKLPFASADSTNIAQNIGIDSAWKGTYTPVNKEARAQVMRHRIESHQATVFWETHKTKSDLFGVSIC